MTRRILLGLLVGTPLSALVPKCLLAPEPPDAESEICGPLAVFDSPITGVSVVWGHCYVTTEDGLYVGTMIPGQGPIWQRIDRVPFVVLDGGLRYPELRTSDS